MWIFSLWVPKIPSDLLCPAVLILPHPTLHVNFFLAKATKQRSVLDKTVAKLKTFALFDMGGGGMMAPQNVFDYCAQTLRRRKLKPGDF